MFLHDEGSGGDVDKQHAHREAILEDVAHIETVAQDLGEAASHVGPACSLAAFAGQRLAHAQGARQQQCAKEEQQPEDALPSPHVGHHASAHGSCHGGDAVHRADEGHRAGQFVGRAFVSGNRTRQHHASRAGNALHQPQGDKLHDVAGEDAAQRGEQEERHGGNQRAVASVTVAQRAEDELPHSQPDHAGGQPQLHHRRRSVEEV